MITVTHDPADCISLAEAGRLLAQKWNKPHPVSRTTLMNWVRQGFLPVMIHEGRYKLPQPAIELFEPPRLGRDAYISNLARGVHIGLCIAREVRVPARYAIPYMICTCCGQPWVIGVNRRSPDGYKTILACCHCAHIGGYDDFDYRPHEYVYADGDTAYIYRHL